MLVPYNMYTQLASEILEASVSVWDNELKESEDGITLSAFWEIFDKYFKVAHAEIITVDYLGAQISNIINQNWSEKTDGQCIDEIVELMKKYQLYKESTKEQ